MTFSTTKIAFVTSGKRGARIAANSTLCPAKDLETGVVVVLELLMDVKEAAMKTIMGKVVMGEEEDSIVTKTIKGKVVLGEK